MTTKAFEEQCTFEIEELEQLFSLKIENKENHRFSISTDSRNIKPSQIFLPLVGESFDGHDFINQVFERDINLSFCEKKKTSKVNEKHKNKLLVVENSLNAYHKIANYHRKKINPKVIAITGSSGKTTVKDLISTVLSQKFKTHKTEKNFNNEFGVPKTILEMAEGTQILVLELAMRGKGQISQLSKTAEPDIAIITNISSAHIGILGNLNEIIEAKCEIFEHLKKDGSAFLVNDPALVAHAKNVLDSKSIKEILFQDSEATNVKIKEGKTFFSFSQEDYCINALGKVHLLNAILAIKISKLLGLTKDEINKGLMKFKIPSGRGNVISLSKDKFLIDESYNANPDSVRAAVSNLIDCWDKKNKKILVLGELAELGQHEENLLNELNQWLSAQPITSVITLGKQLKGKITGRNVINVNDLESCCNAVKQVFLKETVLLVKGSHVAGLEKVIEYLNKQEEE